MRQGKACSLPVCTPMLASNRRTFPPTPDADDSQALQNGVQPASAVVATLCPSRLIRRCRHMDLTSGVASVSNPLGSQIRVGALVQSSDKLRFKRGFSPVVVTA